MTRNERLKDEKVELLKLYGEAEECRKKISKLDKQIESLDNEFGEIIMRYRTKSVCRVLAYIRSKKQLSARELDILLCHCQNKLKGHIDGEELDLVQDEEVQKSND